MKAKQKVLWSCGKCGHTQAKWSGQCQECESWNTLHEEKQAAPSTHRASRKISSKVISLEEVSLSKEERLAVGMEEFDRLLGGGIVPGLFALIGGEPGVGKSTLMMQMAQKLCEKGKKVLYVCGEESVQQTSLRAKRLGVNASNLLLLNELALASILAHIEEQKPDVVIVDSIQIIYQEELPSAPGSVAQVRECAAELMQQAKNTNSAIFVVGHVTKSGELAGPRVLEHLVDTVLYFEGDRKTHYRLLRAVKNRFGATDEVAVFQMQEGGLREVAHPSELFLEERHREQAGSVIFPTLEGSRPILVEVQALVCKTNYPTPSRRAAGFDPNRLALLLAVLEKYIKFPMPYCDVFVSIAGGLRIQEPSADLSVLLAIASSFRAKALPAEMVVVGEIGLGGEVRGSARLEARIKEAKRMGFNSCLCPRRSLKGLPKGVLKGMEVKAVDTVKEAIDAILG